MAEKAPITCHVLDTTAGRPAANIAVTLEATSSPLATKPVFRATTDSDGRIKLWDMAVESTLAAVSADGQKASRWTLRFDTGAYFGAGKTFFPEVVVVFEVQPGQHYHVPLLLSPYSYSTYRGS
ncbi:hypothetical protein TD95_005164 [Thielaviopsis punctulata]|uniref:5-hydroxyisourate hydrolase n=1 Tax=Thielaviopsis punctulata TaxID=72032 RepID=A0A0F4ZIB1_9PEZI|nr:hypothetical protein TD95_005164 [Thielaviopsis punctulata]